MAVRSVSAAHHPSFSSVSLYSGVARVPATSVISSPVFEPKPKLSAAEEMALMPILSLSQ